jgi:hypothetical protein
MKEYLSTLFGALLLGLILVLPAYSAETLSGLLSALIS